jgi:hypothetical protein
MLDIQDIRTIIDAFLDVPSLNALFVSFKIPYYVRKNKKYQTLVKNVLNEKKETM